MNELEEMVEKWSKLCIEDADFISQIEAKVWPLLEHSDEDFVKQGMELLGSFEPVLLFIALEQQGERLVVPARFAFNREQIEIGIMQEVSNEYSDWFAVLQQGYFDSMLRRVYWPTDWSKLSAEMRLRLWTESKRMIPIPPGKLQLQDQDSKEEVFREVTLDRPFVLGQFTVTRAWWEVVMNGAPDESGDMTPKRDIRWFDCVRFCNQLSRLEGVSPAYRINGEQVSCDFDSQGYRLPTEAEWELSDSSNKDYQNSYVYQEIAWFNKNSHRNVSMIGLRKPNIYDLYDMRGHVWEWIWNWQGKDSKTLNPTGPASGSYRILRGGSFSDYMEFQRRSHRPNGRFGHYGFRLARTLPH